MRHALLLSPHSSVPMYAQIVEQVIAKVMAGAWPPGEALPSIRELAGDCQVSVITVKRAYLELERAGVIVTRHGKGSFVADALDATRSLAGAEFDAQLQGLLDAGARLGLGREALLDRVGTAFDAAAGRSHPPTAPRTKGTRA